MDRELAACFTLAVLAFLLRFLPAVPTVALLRGSCTHAKSATTAEAAT